MSNNSTISDSSSYSIDSKNKNILHDVADVFDVPEHPVRHVKQNQPDLVIAENSYPIQTGMGPMTDRVIGDFINKINRGEIKNPFGKLIENQIKPYMYIGAGMYFF